MAKEFKNFDKTFSKTEIAKCRSRYIKLASNVTSDFWVPRIDTWTPDEIRYAVYEAPDHLDWQLFRVSLKGLRTSEKMHLLWSYYNDHMSIDNNDQWKITRCRVDNYLNALKRSGHLSVTGTIMKE